MCLLSTRMEDKDEIFISVSSVHDRVENVPTTNKQTAG